MNNNFNNSKLLSALCYFSVFFAPFLVPIIIYFVSDEHEVKGHAKRALFSHLIPVIILIAGFIVFSFSLFSFDYHMNHMMVSGGFWNFTPFLFMLIYFVLFSIILIWNVIQGVKVLK